MNGNLSIGLTDNLGWVTCSVSVDLQNVFDSFVARHGYIDDLHLMREIKHNGVCLSRLYRIGDALHPVQYAKVHDQFVKFLEGAIYG